MIIYLFSKIGNVYILENLFLEEEIHNLPESHNFLEFGKKR